MNRTNRTIEPLFTVNGLFPAYFAGQSGFTTEQLPDFAYVLDGHGWKIWKRNGISTALIPVESVSGVAALETEIDFKAAKLPLELVRKVTAWFKAVYQQYQSEAVGYLYYRHGSEGAEWDFVPPAQTASAAHASYDRVPKRDGWQTVGTIHSHGSMSAFHSGTDDADEEFFDGVHITVGTVDAVPEYSCSIVVQGERKIVDPSVLIDGMAPAETVPETWLSAIKQPAPVGLEAPFQAQAEDLYARYFSGELTEPAYTAQLEKLEKRSDAAREKAAAVLAAVSNPPHRRGKNKKGGKGKTVVFSTDRHNYQKGGDDDDWDGRDECDEY